MIDTTPGLSPTPMAFYLSHTTHLDRLTPSGSLEITANRHGNKWVEMDGSEMEMNWLYPLLPQFHPESDSGSL